MNPENHTQPEAEKAPAKERPQVDITAEPDFQGGSTMEKAGLIQEKQKENIKKQGELKEGIMAKLGAKLK